MIEKGFRQDETWIAVDPIVGCGMNCQYCFLKTYGETPRASRRIMTQDESLDKLLEFETYDKQSAIMFGSETDMFMNRNNIDYLKDLLALYDDRHIGNPVALVTKKHIPDDFIDFVNGLSNTKLIFYLSYSGLPREIEPGTDASKLRANFVRLAEAGQNVVHYWRPFLPQNSDPEIMAQVIDHAAKYARCTVTSGLKINDDLKNIYWFWPELQAANLDLAKIASIWPKGTKQYLEEYTRLNHPNYPIFYVNSCALAYVLDIPDYNGIYKSDICDNNHCPTEQRNLCQSVLSTYKPTNVQLGLALGRVQVGHRAFFDHDNRTVIVNGALEHGQLVYLTQALNYKVRSTSSVSSDHEWGGSVLGKVDIEI